SLNLPLILISFNMIQIDDKLISQDICSEEFVCNLSKCKGVCCVEGDIGAPLNKEETVILDRSVYQVKPYLRTEVVEAIKAQGTWVFDPNDGDYVTPMVEGRECAYVIFDDKGITKCGIEKAYEDGAVDWQKPISCHLYPIRVDEYRTFTALNYHKWDICAPACTLGKELQVPVYKFLKTPLIRKYGKEFYDTLCDAAEEWNREFNSL